jgi:hypothetical protein
MDQSIGNKGRYEYPATKTRVMTWCAEEIEIVNATGWSVGQGFVEYTFLVVGVFKVVTVMVMWKSNGGEGSMRLKKDERTAVHDWWRLSEEGETI